MIPGLHCRCAVFDPRLPVTLSEDERADAATDLAEMMLAMRDDICEMADNGRAVQVQVDPINPR